MPGWSVFPASDGPPDSCDKLLAYDEALLCMAGQLADISSSIRTITWTEVTKAPTLPDFPPGPWTIPPQANKDRFVARDLAIYMLATLAANDSWFVNYPANTNSCASAYTNAASDPAGYGASNESWLFGAFPYYFPPNGPAGIPERAESRLRIQTQILRSASRLLDELIDKSVEADLASAAQRRARATDPSRGSEIAWGVRGDENGKFGSLAHAIRVVGGRWELSPIGVSSFAGVLPFYTADPACGGTSPQSILESGYGADFGARVADRDVRTTGQQAAVQIVETAGVVVPGNEITPAKLGSVRAALRQQIVGTAAMANGLPPTDTHFNEDLQGKSVGYVLDDVTDGDLNSRKGEGSALRAQVARAAEAGAGWNAHHQRGGQGLLLARLIWNTGTHIGTQNVRIVSLVSAT